MPENSKHTSISDLRENEQGEFQEVEQTIDRTSFLTDGDPRVQEQPQSKDSNPFRKKDEEIPEDSMRVQLGSPLEVQEAALVNEYVEIRQAPDMNSFNTGIGKYKRSKFPGCPSVFQIAQYPDGRYITGLDEDAIPVLRIKDANIREEERKRIKELRLALEQRTGLQLNAKSAYWETYYIHLGENVKIALDDANQRIMLEAAIANGYICPDPELINTPEYKDCKFLVWREATQAKRRANTLKEMDEAKAELFKLSEDEHKLELIAKVILGSKINNKTSPSTQYELLSEWINGSTARDNRVSKFKQIVKTPIDQLKFKITVDEAINKKVITYRDGYYQRGNLTYGRDIPAVIRFLSLPDQAGEFASIEDELSEKGQFAQIH